jgi:hypothetical protein
VTENKPWHGLTDEGRLPLQLALLFGISSNMASQKNRKKVDVSGVMQHIWKLLLLLSCWAPAAACCNMTCIWDGACILQAVVWQLRSAVQ